MSEGKRKKLKSAKELALRGLGLVIILIAVISLYQLGKQAYDLYLVRKETVKSSERSRPSKRTMNVWKKNAAISMIPNM